MQELNVSVKLQTNEQYTDNLQATLEQTVSIKKISLIQANIITELTIT